MATKHFRATFQASISTWDLYDRLDNKTLQKMLAGFEFQFDEVHKGALHYPPPDWLSRRMNLISQILESRGLKAAPDKKSATDRIRIVLRKNPQATRIIRWNKFISEVKRDNHQRL